MHARPSAVYGIKPPLAAFCFDRATERFGNAMEDAMRSAAEGAADEKAARASATRRGMAWLASADPAEVRHRGRFRTPTMG